jgi:hypothetical protein
MLPQEMREVERSREVMERGGKGGMRTLEVGLSEPNSFAATRLPNSRCASTKDQW